jgi:hypothetical protein
MWEKRKCGWKTRVLHAKNVTKQDLLSSCLKKLSKISLLNVMLKGRKPLHSCTFLSRLSFWSIMHRLVENAAMGSISYFPWPQPVKTSFDAQLSGVSHVHAHYELPHYALYQYFESFPQCRSRKLWAPQRRILRRHDQGLSSSQICLSTHREGQKATYFQYEQKYGSANCPGLGWRVRKKNAWLLFQRHTMKHFFSLLNEFWPDSLRTCWRCKPAAWSIRVFLGPTRTDRWTTRKGVPNSELLG